MAIETIKNIFQFRHSASPVEAFAKQENKWLKTPDALARYVKAGAGYLFVGIPACILGIVYHALGTVVTLVGFATKKSIGQLKFFTDKKLADRMPAEWTAKKTALHAYKFFMVSFAMPNAILSIFAPNRGALGFFEDTAVVSQPHKLEEVKEQIQPLEEEEEEVVTEVKTQPSKEKEIVAEVKTQPSKEEEVVAEEQAQPSKEKEIVAEEQAQSQPQKEEEVKAEGEPQPQTPKRNIANQQQTQAHLSDTPKRLQGQPRRTVTKMDTKSQQ